MINQYVQPDEKDLTVRKILASRYPESMLLELEDKFVAFFEKNKSFETFCIDKFYTAAQTEEDDVSKSSFYLQHPAEMLLKESKTLSM